MEYMKFRDKSLTIGERIDDLLDRLTVDEKINMLSSVQCEVPRLGVGKWAIGCEAARGFVSKDPNEVSTVFPQPIGMASTFDKELMRKIGEIAGDETRHYYNQDPTGRLMLWGPTVDMERNPLWGRTEEAYGEDPCLAGEMSKEYTIGLAGAAHSEEPADKDIRDCRTDESGVLLKTLPTLKHFCANNNEKDRMCGNSDVTVKLLHEYYYRAFKPALTEGGAHAVMAAYNKIGGVPGDMNPDMQHVLKDEWKMDLAVSDGGAFSQNYLEHGYTNSHAESLALCIKNGTDTMTDDGRMVAAAARDALNKGLISENDINKAVGNVLLGRFRLGEFDDSHKYSDTDTLPDSEYARTINRQAAYKQMCLLKNNGILPLTDKKIPVSEEKRKILIAGPIADENYRDWYTGVASYAISVRKAFEMHFDKEALSFDNGYDYVAVKSKANGKYMSVGDDGKISFSADKITERELFELHKWDKSVYNFKSLFNGKYVTENGTYSASSETPYAWFIKEWFKPHEYGGYVYFESWHDDSVYVNENGELAVKPACRPSDNRLFTVETVSRGTERLHALAHKSDIVIYCAGNHPMQVARECYDRETLALPSHQYEQIMSLPSEKLVLMLISSYPYAIVSESKHASAVLYSSHCGAELGNAVYATIFGENNPAARCPITWYRSEHELPDIKEYDIITSRSTYMYYDGEPLYPFGFGLSYSSFEYSDLTVNALDDCIKISVNVKNTSDTDGDEVVQIYFSADTAPERISKLCGFERVTVKAGETAKFSLEIPKERLEAYSTVNGRMEVFSGKYTFMAGASSKDIRCTADVMISGTEDSFRKYGETVFCKNNDKIFRGSLGFSKVKNDWYIKFGDWGGNVSFESCQFDDADHMIVYASAPCSPARIEIICGRSCIGSAEIPPSASWDDFHEIKIPLEKTPDSTVEFNLQGMSAVYSFKATKDE